MVAGRAFPKDVLSPFDWEQMRNRFAEYFSSARIAITADEGDLD
jgi:hypothetical protein